MYMLVTGDDLPNYELHTKESRETKEEFLKRLVSYGYTRIRFAEIATRIRNFHDVVAYCRGTDDWISSIINKVELKTS